MHLLVGCGGGLRAEKKAMPDPLREAKATEVFRRGLASESRGDYIRAEQYYAAAIDLGYPEKKAMPRLVRVCIASSRLSSALSHSKPYLESHPQDWALRYLVATAYYSLSDFGSAVSHLRRVMHDAPKRPEPHYLLAVIYRDELRDLTQAREHFQRYVDLAPNGEHLDEVNYFLSRSRVEINTQDTAEKTQHSESGSDDESAAKTGESAESNVAPATQQEGSQ